MSSSEDLFKESPFSCIDPKDVTVLVDPEDNTSKEILINEKNIRFVKDKDKAGKDVWRAFVDDKPQGILTSLEDQKNVQTLFGKSWKDFVIPLQSDNGSPSYLVFPFTLSATYGVGVEVENKDIKAVSRPFVLEFDKGSTPISTPEGFLYLAYQSLLEAETQTFSQNVEKALLQANFFIEQSAKTLAKQYDSESFLKVMSMIQAHFDDKQFKGKPQMLATRIKMELAFRDIMDRNKELKTLIDKPTQFRQLEALMTMYGEYKAKVKESPTERKELVLLPAEEKSKLEAIGQQFFSELISQDRINESFPVSQTLSVGLPNTISSDFMLMLLRYARPLSETPPPELKGMTKPLPLNQLLENFWFYARQINENKIQPQELQSLFQPCILPTVEKNELVILQQVEMQARQFLLSYSFLTQQSVKATQDFQKELDTFQKEMGEGFMKEEEVRDTKEQLQELDPFLLNKFENALEALGNIKPSEKKEGEVLPEEGIKDEDLKYLKKKIAEAAPEINSFLESVGKNKSKVEEEAAILRKEKEAITAQLANLSVEQARLKEEIVKLKKQPEQTDSIQKEIEDKENREMEISSTKFELGKKVRDWGKEEAQSVIGKKESFPKAVLLGIYEDVLSELSEVESSFKEVQEKLMQGKTGIEDFEKLRQLQKQADSSFTKIAEQTAPPLGTSPLPDVELLKKLEDLGFTQEPGDKKAALGMAKRALQTLSFKEMKLARKLQKEKEAKYDPLAGKTEDYASFLGLIMFCSNMVATKTNASKEVTFDPTVQRQKGLQIVKDEEHLEKFLSANDKKLSDGEKTKIRERFKTLPQEQGVAFLEKLSHLLEEKKEDIVVKADLDQTLSRITQLEHIAPKKPAEPIGLFEKGPIKEGEGFEETFGSFFKHNASFPSEESKSEIISHFKTHPEDFAKFRDALSSLELHLNEQNKQEMLSKCLIGDPTYDYFIRAFADIVLFSRSSVEDTNEKKVEAKKFVDTNYAMKFVDTTSERTSLKTNQSIENLSSFFAGLSACHGSIIKEIHTQQHLQRLGSVKSTIPQNDSQLAKELTTACENMKEEAMNPLPYSDVVQTMQLEPLEEKMMQRIESLEKDLSTLQDTIFKELDKIDPLPARLQKMKIRGASKSELFATALKMHRNKEFVKYPTLDAAMLQFLVLATQKEQIDKSFSNLDSLKKLSEERKALEKKIATALPEEKQALLNQLQVVEKAWQEESLVLKDLLGRCQDSKAINDLICDKELGPYARKILYMQYRQGIVLRSEQLDVIRDILYSKESTLKELRMGLGKTDVILPFVLDIFGEMGKLPIGILPKALFEMGWDQLDGRLKIVFELSGYQFGFSLQDLSYGEEKGRRKVITESTILHLASKYQQLLEAKQKGEFVLTTIEAKCSLDDSIESLSTRLFELKERKKNLEKEVEQDKKKLGELDQVKKEMRLTYQALTILNKTQKVFTDPDSRVIVDEADEVLKANYSVNFEEGQRDSPDAQMQGIVSDVMKIVAFDEGLKELRSIISVNAQTSFSETQVKEFMTNIARIWLSENMPDLNREDVCAWLSGGPSPLKDQPIPDEDKMKLAIVAKVLSETLPSSLGLKIKKTCDFDFYLKAVGVPATGGVVSPTTKYDDVILQMTLAKMMYLNRPPENAFISSSLKDFEVLVRKSGDLEAITEFEELKGKAEGNPEFNWEKELSGQDRASVSLRLMLSDLLAERKMIYFSTSQIKRPVQDALRGAHVIALTGTATHNLDFIVNDTKSVEEKGRASSAEVLYRYAASSPQGLDTPVKTYSQDNKAVFEDMLEIANEKVGGEYPNAAVINEAAVCDDKTNLEFVEELSNKSGRPVGFVDIDGLKKIFYQGKKWDFDVFMKHKAFSKVIKDVLFYYDPARTRGTNFVIPLGKKGVVFLSPKVNASVRDQSGYRMRKLGQGHEVEMRVAESQKKELEKEGTGTLKDLLLKQHKQTEEDERKEFAEAFVLSINSIGVKAAEAIRQGIVPENFDELHEKDIDEKIDGYSDISQLLRRYFTKQSNIESYKASLLDAFSRGDEQETKVALQQMIGKEKSTLKFFHTKIEEKLKSALPSQKSQWEYAKKEIEEAIVQLDKQNSKLDEHWEEFAPKIIQKMPKVSTSAGVSSSESLAEQQQQSISQTQTQTQKIQKNARKAIEEFDKELMDSIPKPRERFGFERHIGEVIDAIGSENPLEKFGEPRYAKVSPLGPVVTKGVLRALKSAPSFRPASFAQVVFDKKPPFSIFLTNEEAVQFNNSTTIMHWVDRDSKIVEGAILTAFQDPEKGITLRTRDVTIGQESYEPKLQGSDDDTKKRRGELLLNYLFLGALKFSDSNWEDMKMAYDARTDKEAFDDQVIKHLSANNASLLAVAKEKFGW